jgi:uncharacterized membrane protein AbrB (regulator of aidB expression)
MTRFQWFLILILLALSTGLVADLTDMPATTVMLACITLAWGFLGELITDID